MKIYNEHSFCRDVERDPDSLWNIFRIKQLGYFNKPEGEGCLEKMGAFAYCVGKPSFMLSTAWAWSTKMKVFPAFLHVARWGTVPVVAACVFAVTSCNVCAYRKKDSPINHAIGGALAGGIMTLVIKHQFWHWMAFNVPFYALAAAIHHWADIRALSYKVYRTNDGWNPHEELYNYETKTLPDHRLSIDLVGGPKSDVPFAWIGEKWEHRDLLCKQKFGYLEGELDRIPEYEKILANRV